MAWPDLSRKLWSYIIAKIGLFTDIDPSKLELSSNSLSLNDVDVDRAKLNVPGVTVSQCSIKKLLLELNSSGFSVNATEIELKARVDTFETPDLAISMILETTKTDLAELGKIEEPQPPPQQRSSSLVAKLADMALSQISARVSKINLEIEIPGGGTIIIYISEAFMSSKHRIEFESITVHRRDYNNDRYSDSETDSEPDSDAHEDFSDNEEDNRHRDQKHDYMSKSIYLDARASLEALDGKESTYSDDKNLYLLALIDQVTFTYWLDPVGFNINMDRARIDGLQSLETLVMILNVVITGETAQPRNSMNESSGKDTTESTPGDMTKGKEAFSLECLEIYESLENAGSSPVSLTSIHYEDSELKISALEIPGIVQITPFLSLHIAEQLSLNIQMPISATIPLEKIASLKRIIESLASILENLSPPVDAEPTPLSIQLPEIRIAVGDNLTINIFPNEGSEKGIEFREITVTLANSQLVMSKVDLGFQGSLSIKTMKLKMTTGIHDEILLLRSLILPEVSASPSSLSEHSSFAYDILSRERTNIIESLSKLNVNLSHIEIDYYENDQARFKGTMKFKIIENVSKFEAKLFGKYNGSESKLEVIAMSLNYLKSIDATIRCRLLDIYQSTPFEEVSSNAADQSNSTNSILRMLPELNVELVFENDVRLTLNDTKMVVIIDHSKLSIANSKLSFHLPRIYADLIDPTGSDKSIPILKVKDLRLSYQQFVNIDLGTVVFMTCADTYDFINKFLSELTPKSKPPIFQVEPVDALDIFHETDNTQFVASNLEATENRELPIARDGKLEIQEDYMGSKINGSKGHSKPGLMEASTLWGKIDTMRVLIKRLQWQIYDGFDFEETRQKMREAINQVSQVAADLVDDSRESSSGDESPVVGDFMYNSVLITAPSSRASDLKKEVAKELGTSSSLERGCEPKLILNLRKFQISTRLIDFPLKGDHRSQLTLNVRDGNLSDLVATSRFNNVIRPIEIGSKQDVFAIVADTVGPESIPEVRAKVQIRPLHLSLDQDTVEFIARFFQFTSSDDTNIDGVHDEEKEGGDGSSSLTKEEPFSSSSSSTFIQRFEFGGLAVTIDYTPKKVDYRSLRSGMAAELLNIFAVRGAKLTLQRCTLHGIDGWDRLLTDLGDVWMPDIRGNQLFGLIAGINPIRRAVKVSKGVSNYTLVPIKQKQITRGAGVIVRRTLDELLRFGASWLDSTDKALGGG